MSSIPEIAHPLDKMEGEVKEQFRITNDEAASWAMRKLRTIRSKQAENKQMYEDEMARLEFWLVEVNGPLDSNAAYFESILTDYALRCRDAKDDGRKSLRLPNGKVTTRETPPKWEIEAEAFIAWAKRNNQRSLIRVKEEPNLLALKEFAVWPTNDLPSTMNGTAITGDGEVIPGVRITPSQVSVTVSPELK